MASSALRPARRAASHQRVGTADLVLAIALGVTSTADSPLQLFAAPGSLAMQFCAVVVCADRSGPDLAGPARDHCREAAAREAEPGILIVVVDIQCREHGALPPPKRGRAFDAHGLLPDWPSFLDDFQLHWPTDEDHTYVDFVREGVCGNGAARIGNARWRRVTEERAGGAKSVFHFDVPGSVAKATHAGIPWLRFMRHRVGPRAHFWPFDGWDIPAGRSAVAEVYPALWSRGFANEGRTGDQHDAFTIAAWLSRADRDGSLAAFLDPDLSPPDRALGQVEGWILGTT